MSSWRQKDDDEEDEEGEGGEEEEEETSEEFKAAADRLIFLIDAREAMQKKNKHGEVIAIHCLSIALSVMKSKVISDDKASVSVILFGQKNDSGTPGIYRLIPLEPPSASSIRDLQAMVSDPSKLEAKISTLEPISTEITLKDALWACSSTFFNSSSSKTRKQDDFHRIWLFTNDDKPDSHVANQAETANRDLMENGVELSLWNISPTRSGGLNFDVNAFYRKLLVVKHDDDDVEDEMDEEEILASRVIGTRDEKFEIAIVNRRKQAKKRILCVIPMAFGQVQPTTTEPTSNDTKAASTVNSGETTTDNNNTSSSNAGDAEKISPHMYVQIYKLLSVSKMPLPTKLSRDKNEPVKSIRKKIDAVTGKTLSDAEIAKHLMIKGTNARLPFSEDEMKALKKAGSEPHVPGISILFFAPSAKIFERFGICNISTPLFVFPDEKGCKGSSALFGTLLHDLARKDLVAVVKFVRSPTSAARMAILIPQLEVCDSEDGAQLQPGGFNMVIVPFLEEVRGNPAPPPPQHLELLKEEMVSAAGALVQAMKYPDEYDFTIEMENPVLQNFYSVLQAVALSEQKSSWDPYVDDKMKPIVNPATLSEIETFRQSANLLSPSDLELEGTNKRKRAAAPKDEKKGSSGSKSQSGGSGGGDGSVNYAAMTIPELKELCKQNNLKVGGNKSDLITRLQSM